MFKPSTFQPLPLPLQVQYVFVPCVLFTPVHYRMIPMMTHKEREKSMRSEPFHEWKNSTTLAVPTIATPPPIKISSNLSMTAPFAPIKMLTTEEKSNVAFQRCLTSAYLSKHDYQAMATSISVAEFALE